MTRLQSKIFFCVFSAFFIFCQSGAVARQKVLTAILSTDFKPVSWNNRTIAQYFYSSKNNIHILKIDLKNPKMHIVSYPSVDDSDSVTDAGFLSGLMLSQFVRKTNALMAVNTSPYWINTESQVPATDKKFKILGVHSADKMQFSKPLEKYPALVMYRTPFGLSAKIASSQTAAALAAADFAFGGYFLILNGGKKIDFQTEQFNARTAVGLTASGDELYILACKKSPGLSFQECQEIFLSLGCVDAIEFDGGSSTSFFLKSKEKSVKIQSFLRVNASYMGFLFDD
mgnify:CR=1 FL=1